MIDPAALAGRRPAGDKPSQPLGVRRSHVLDVQREPPAVLTIQEDRVSQGRSVQLVGVHDLDQNYFRSAMREEAESFEDRFLIVQQIAEDYQQALAVQQGG